MYINIFKPFIFLFLYLMKTYNKAQDNNFIGINITRNLRTQRSESTTHLTSKDILVQLNIFPTPSCSSFDVFLPPTCYSFNCFTTIYFQWQREIVVREQLWKNLLPVQMHQRWRLWRVTNQNYIASVESEVHGARTR